MLHFAHSPHRYYITFTESWKPIQIQCRNIRSEKLYNGDPGIKSHLYCKTSFLHDLMDNKTDQHYFFRGHVWPSMRNDLPHNVLIVLSVTSGAIIHASCQPCNLYCKALSDSDHNASFCTLTLSILDNFHRILVTDSLPMRKDKKS